MGLPHAALSCALLLIGLSWSAPGSAQWVQIDRLEDQSGADAEFSPDIIRRDDVCIATTGGLGRYSVTATGSGMGSVFKLAGPGGTLDYDVQWNARARESSGTPLTPGGPLRGLRTSLLSSVLGCIAGTDSATLIITIRSGDLSRAMAGTYTGKLTLLVTAE